MQFIGYKTTRLLTSRRPRFEWGVVYLPLVFCCTREQRKQAWWHGYCICSHLDSSLKKAKTTLFSRAWTNDAAKSHTHGSCFVRPVSARLVGVLYESIHWRFTLSATNKFRAARGRQEAEIDPGCRTWPSNTILTECIGRLFCLSDHSDFA